MAAPEIPTPPKSPRPLRAVGRPWRRLIRGIRDRVDQELAQPHFQRDPGAVARALPTVSRIAGYYRPEVRGFENVPASGPMLLVGNHNGGIFTPETHILFASWVKEFGPHRALYGLGHNMALVIPYLGPIARRLGVVPACHDSAEQALDQGSAVLVYPGGDHEAYRPYWHRRRIDFGNRKGFIKLALKTGVPIVPVVAYGSHETTIVLARGTRLAKALGLNRVNTKVLPISLTFPWGVAPGFVPHVPLPSKVHMEFLPALNFSQHGPSAADDPDVVQACYDEVRNTMQTALDRLSSARRFPWFS